MNLLEKFKPKIISDIVGNKLACSNLISEINSFYAYQNSNVKRDETSTQIICLLGPTGSGKTLITKLVLESMNAEILDITRDNNTNKELNNLMYNFANNTRIDTLFTKKKKIILIDDIDILIHTEKNIISQVLQCLPMLKKRKIPIIMTCRINQDKKLIDLKKYVAWIKIFYPSVNELFPKLSQFLEECKYVLDDETLLKIIKSNRCNIRETILNINSSENDVKLREDTTRFRNLNNFEIVQLFLKNTYSLDQVINLLKDDSNLTSYILYENFPDELVNNRDYKKKNQKHIILNDYEYINTCYTHSSIFEDYMFSNTDWSLNFYVSYLKLRGINIILQNIGEKKRRKTNTLRFSQILSKISHKNIMNKKINSIINENSLDFLEILSIVDNLAIKHHQEGKLSCRKKNLGLNTDEMNLLNTYIKYLMSK